MSDNTDWDCPTCGRPTPTEIDVECHCGMMASHHVSISTMCKRLREAQQRESALIVEVNEQARLLGMSAERECDLRGDLQNRRDLFKLQEHLMDELKEQFVAERDLADRLAKALLSFCSSGMVWPNTDTPEKAIAAWKEARIE